MTTTSFPITGDNITHGQWANLGGVGDGIRKGDPFVLSPTTNDLTVPSGTHIGFRGFLLDVTTDHLLTLPAVTSDTTYRVAVMYDPANEAAAGGPLSLVAPVVGSEGVPAGGALLPLQDITRRNGVALNASTVQDYRYFNRGALTAPTALALPPASFYSKGAHLVLPTGLYVHNGSAWVAVENDSGWRYDGFSAKSGWTNNGCAWRTRNGLAELRIRGKRTGSTLTFGTTGDLSDTAALVMPDATECNWLLVGSGSFTTSTIWGFEYRIYNGSNEFTITSGMPNGVIGSGHYFFANLAYLLD